MLRLFASAHVPGITCGSLWFSSLNFHAVLPQVRYWREFSRGPFIIRHGNETNNNTPNLSKAAGLLLMRICPRDFSEYEDEQEPRKPVLGRDWPLCQLGFTETEGQFTTPYYDTQYPNNLDCAWTISVDAELTELRLNFTAFDLEESVNCTADYVEIRDGSDNLAPLIAKYCGKALPKPLKTSAQSLYIMFHTDELDAFKGFNAEWSSTRQDNHMKSWEVALLVVGILLLCLLMAGAAFVFYRHRRQPKPYQSVTTTYHL
ncbi:hypothetical protein OS493_004726 [Desmophyllum pertusum]|uniref:CUB domain-containing protein n=1 Tax=Desmophyllum pertusum TaxID=174260 RepID=A0A9W9ZIB2_9CNID|nr:hypothetical protein OS493_004726 [Desmophyllum pertusum]